MLLHQFSILFSSWDNKLVRRSRLGNLQMFVKHLLIFAELLQKSA